MIGEALLKILDTPFGHLLMSTFPVYECDVCSTKTKTVVFYLVNNVAVFPLRTICFLFIRCGLTVRVLSTGSKPDLFYKIVNNKLGHT